MGQDQPLPEIPDLTALNPLHRGRWWALAIVFAVIFAALAMLAVSYFQNTSQLSSARRQLARDERHIAASCRFWRDLSPLPVTVNTATHQAAELGVKIITDSRKAFRGQGCPGALPAPSPSLVHWAAFYHIPVVR